MGTARAYLRRDQPSGRERRVVGDRPLAFIGAPTSAGAFAPGQEGAPAALRQAGLIDRLRAGGFEVDDRGDTPHFRWRPDREHPAGQNLEAVVHGVQAVAAAVEAALGEGLLPLVIGGDCTVGVGTVAGAVAAGGRPGLVYLDLHPDLNVPVLPGPGAFDWMGMAHALDVAGAAPELASAASRRPLLAPEDVAFLGYGPSNRTPFETALMERLGAAAAIPVQDVAAAPAAAAHAARGALAGAERLLVHFDTDLVDFTDAPLSENTGRNEGLPLASALEALAVLIDDERLSAVTVTELNPLHGEEGGATLERFVGALARALGA
jgi:arginase